MKPFSAADISEGVLAVSNDLSDKMVRAVSRYLSDDLKSISAHLRAGRFEEAKTETRELKFTEAVKAQEKTIRIFARSAALVGAGAIDRPQTSVMAQAGFPHEIDKSVVTLIENMVTRMLVRDVRRRLLERVTNASRFQKSDPIDPDKLARDINRFLRGEIRRVVDVSSNIVGTRVAAHGMLYEARARGITRYRIDAILDDRTTDICRNMDGREFEVEEAYYRTQTALSITEPSDLKEYMPFPQLNEVRGETNRQLQQKGFDTPPFHFLCRSVVTLVGVDTEYEQVPVSKFPDEAPAYEASVIDDLFEKYQPITQAAIKVDNQDALIAAKEVADTVVQHPGGDGTAARAFSINAYTGNVFNPINTALRQKSRFDDPDHREIVRTFDRIFDDLPELEEDLIVYRGAAGTVLDQLDDIGKVVQDDGLISTSVTPGSAMQFGRKDAILQILVPRGQKALPLGDLSLTKYEGEVVLDRSTQFRVIGDTEITLGDGSKKRVIRVVAQGVSKQPDIDNLPDFEQWIEEQESLIKEIMSEERSRAKFFYLSPRDLFQVALTSG